MHLFTGYGLSLMTLYRTVSGRFHQRLDEAYALMDEEDPEAAETPAE